MDRRTFLRGALAAPALIAAPNLAFGVPNGGIRRIQGKVLNLKKPLVITQSTIIRNCRILPAEGFTGRSLVIAHDVKLLRMEGCIIGGLKPEGLRRIAHQVSVSA